MWDVTVLLPVEIHGREFGWRKYWPQNIQLKPACNLPSLPSSKAAAVYFEGQIIVMCLSIFHIGELDIKMPHFFIFFLIRWSYVVGNIKMQGRRIVNTNLTLVLGRPLHGSSLLAEARIPLVERSGSEPCPRHGIPLHPEPSRSCWGCIPKNRIPQYSRKLSKPVFTLAFMKHMYSKVWQLSYLGCIYLTRNLPALSLGVNLFDITLD